MKKMNRREWLKWAAASLASSVVLPTFLTACGEDNEPLPEPAPGAVHQMLPRGRSVRDVRLQREGQLPVL